MNKINGSDNMKVSAENPATTHTLDPLCATLKEDNRSNKIG